jgi:hypothetical protein
VFEYSEFLSGNIKINSWVFRDLGQADLEIWVDGEYSQTISIDLNVRECVWDLTKEVVA